MPCILPSVDHRKGLGTLIGMKTHVPQHIFISTIKIFNKFISITNKDILP